MVERAFYVMGTTLEIKVFCKDQSVCDKAIAEAHEEVKRLDHIFSNYKTDSVLSKFHSVADEGKYKVPKVFIKLIELSIEYSYVTGGAFDITVAKLVDVWKASQERNKVPTENEINEALRCVGYEKIKLYPSSSEIELDPPCVRLDFGGIGKGYAVDKVVEILNKHGIKRGIVNFSGNMFAMNPPPDSDGWDIGIRNPRVEFAPITMVRIRNMSISTSGDYERYLLIEGKSYSHIINPKNGMPISSVPSVTVLSKSATSADALSTALTVIGHSQSLNMLKNMPAIEALIIREIDGNITLQRSKGFSKYEIDN